MQINSECTDAAGYPLDKVIACDIDRDAVADWQMRRPAAKVEVSDVSAFSACGPRTVRSLMQI